MQAVEHMGLHWDGAVAWLLQPEGEQNFLGLKGPSPFKLPRMRSDHRILPPVADPSDMGPVADPLYQAMLPVPHGPDARAHFLIDPKDQLAPVLRALSRLSSPSGRIMFPAWAFNKRFEVDLALSRTNVQPLIITQAEPRHYWLLEHVTRVSSYFPRTVILTGSADLPIPKGLNVISTDIAVAPDLPWEDIGYVHLRDFARKAQHGS